MCVCVRVHARAHACVLACLQVREQLAGIGSFLLQQRPWGLI